jgi:hypothetical protein
MTVFYYLRFKTPPTWRASSPYLYPPGTEWPSYTPRHLVPFSSPPTTRRAMMEVFESASTWATFLCQSQSQSYFTTGGLPPISSSWRQAPWDPRADFFFRLNSCGNSPYVASSLTRRWVCLSQICLVFRPTPRYIDSARTARKHRFKQLLHCLVLYSSYLTMAVFLAPQFLLW